jgi:hypothetical protein
MPTFQETLATTTVHALQVRLLGLLFLVQQQKFLTPLVIGEEVAPTPAHIALILLHQHANALAAQDIVLLELLVILMMLAPLAEKLIILAH